MLKSWNNIVAKIYSFTFISDSKDLLNNYNTAELKTIIWESLKNLKYKI